MAGRGGGRQTSLMDFKHCAVGQRAAALAAREAEGREARELKRRRTIYFGAGVDGTDAGGGVLRGPNLLGASTARVMDDVWGGDTWLDDDTWIDDIACG